MINLRQLAIAVFLVFASWKGSPLVAGESASQGLQQTFAPPKLVVRTGHPGIIADLATNAAGTLLASVGDDSTVRVWDVKTGAVIRTLSGHPEQLASVTFVRNDEWIFASGGSRASIWDVTTGRLLKTLEGSRASIDNTGGLLATAVGRILRVVDVATGQKIQEVIVDRSSGPPLLEVMRTGFSPDGLLAAAMSDGTVRLWDARQGKQLDTLRLHEKQVTQIEFSSDGQLLITAGSDTYASVFDLRARKVRGRLNLASAPMSVSVNDAYIAIADGHLTLPLWDRETLQPRPELKSIGSMWYVKMAPAGAVTYVAIGSEIQGWDVASPTRISTFKGDVDTYSILKFPLSKPVVLGAGTLSGLRFWDLVHGMPARSLPGEEWAFHPSGLVVASSSVNGVRMRASFATGTPRKISTTSASVIAFSPNGQFVATGVDETVTIQRVKDGSILKRWNEKDRIEQIEFDGTSARVAIALGDDVVLRDANTGAIRFQLGQNAVYSPRIAFHPTDLILAVGTSDGSVATIDLRSKPTAVDLSRDTTVPWVTAIAWSPDGRFVVTGHRGNDLHVWSVEDQIKAATLTGHNGAINAVTFDAAGKWLATGSDDGTVRLWRVGKWTEAAALVTFGGFHARQNAYEAAARRANPGTAEQEIREFANSVSRLTVLGASEELAKYGFDGIELDDPEWLVVSPAGFFDGTPAAMAAVSWTTDGASLIEPLEAFFNDYYRPGLLSEILADRSPQAEFDLPTITRVPGLRRMLTEGLAWLDQRTQGTVVCFSEPPTSVVSPELVRVGRPRPAAVDQFRFTPADAECPFQMLLPGNLTLQQWQLALPARATSTNLSTASRTAIGTLRLLTIGNQNFANSAKFPSLPGSTASATDLRRYFEEASAALKSRGVFQDIDIRAPVRDGTTAQIEAAIASLARDVRAEDTVLIFLSGHGIVPAGSEMFYFVASDTAEPTEEALKKAGLSTAMLAHAVRRIPAKRLVIVLDTCQSGAAVEALARVGTTRLTQQSAIADLTSKPVDDEGGMVVISATTPLQVAVQSSAGSSLASGLLQVLKRKTGKVLLASELATEIVKIVPQISASLYVAQRPDVAASGSDFPLSVR